MHCSSESKDHEAKYCESAGDNRLVSKSERLKTLFLSSSQTGGGDLVLPVIM